MLRDLPINTVDAAKALLGQLLVRKIGGQELIGKIVETEAYLGADDVASHAYRGQTPRNSAMFGQAGRAYVYFTYGMHYCLNVVTSRAGVGEAVLIQALEPIQGMKLMKQRRHTADKHNLTNGPAKLCQALGIDKQLNGHKLDQAPLYLKIGESVPPNQIATTTRIGIREERPRPLRFYIRDNPFISKKHR